jgi:hypothetical protein
MGFPPSLKQQPWLVMVPAFFAVTCGDVHVEPITTGGEGSGGGAGGSLSGGGVASTTSTSGSGGGPGTSTSAGGASGTNTGSGGGGVGGDPSSSMSSGITSECPVGTTLKFPILDHEFPNFGPVGCSGDNTPVLVSAASILNQSVLTMHVRKVDNSPFSTPATLTLYVGIGPTCPNPPNVPKATKAVLVGDFEQRVNLQVNPYDAAWAVGETKIFWVGWDDGGLASWLATGTITVQKTCAP